MKVCTYFVLFRIFAYTNSRLLRTTIAAKDGIDLDLDGSLKLYVGKNTKNISDKRTIGNHKISRRDSRSPGVETFTDFIQEVIKTLNSYDDNTYKDFITVLDTEIKKYHYKGYKYHELLKNDEIRRFIDEKFDSIVGKTISFVKDNLNEVAENIKRRRYDKNLKKLLNLINSLYKEDDREKFRKVLTDLREFDKTNHGMSKNDLIKVIRHGIWSIVFHHYTNMNDKEKRELQKEITVYLKRNTDTKVGRHKSAVSELNDNNLNPKSITTKVFKVMTLKTMEPKSTTQQITTKNKRRSNLKPNTNEESENKDTTHEASQEESDSQQLILTYKSTMESSGESTDGTSREITTDTSSDDTVEYSFSELSRAQHRKLNAQPYDTLYIEDFYKTTVKPALVKPEMRSRVEEASSTEEISDRLQTTRPQTNGRPRYRTSSYSRKKRIMSRNSRRSRHLSDNDKNNSGDLRRSIAPPLPEEELSVEVFERERIKRERSLAKSYSFVKNNSIQHGLKDYVKRRRSLAKKINELKKIYENIQLSKINDTTNFTTIENAFEVTDKNIQQQFEDAKNKIAVTETQSNTHYVRAQTETNDIQDEYTTYAFKNTNSINKDLEDNIKETVETDDIKRKITKTEEINETTNATNIENTDTEFRYSTKPMTTKLYDLKSVKIPVYIELLATAMKKKDVSETTYKATKKIDNEI